MTHTSADAVGARGMWYYYAAGCSDVLLSLGRVLVASNGVDAALQLLRAAHPDSDAADAARRLAALKPAYVGRRVEQARRKLGPAHANASAEWLLLRAADLRQCRYRLRPLKVLWADRVGALATSVAVDDWWQDVAEELLLRLGYDTLALLEAPWMKNIAGNSGFWGTEIWDVRSLKGLPRRRDKFHDRNPGAAALRHNPRQVVRHLSVAGRRCAPARHFENCLACEGSELASVCAAEPERCRARGGDYEGRRAQAGGGAVRWSVAQINYDQVRSHISSLGPVAVARATRQPSTYFTLSSLYGAPAHTLIW